MEEVHSILTAVQDGASGIIVSLGACVALAGAGIAKVIDAWTRRSLMLRSLALPLPSKDQEAEDQLGIFRR